MLTLRRLLQLGFGALLLCGCPRRFDPAAAPPITSQDTQVAGAFAGCLHLFDANKLPQADGCFAHLITISPTDPARRSAQLYRGRIALRQGKTVVAKQALVALADTKLTTDDKPAERALVRAARYYLGLAVARLGEHRRAIALLSTLSGKLATEAQPALAAALARAYEGNHKIERAAEMLEQLYAATKRPVERLHARLELQRIVDQRLDLQRVRALFARSSAGGLLRAMCARRLITDARARGDLAGATRVDEKSADAMRRHAVTVAASAAGSRVGVLLPFSGRYRRVGKLAFDGVAVAASAFSAAGDPLELVLRDSSRHALAAARFLVESEHVAALVGVFDRRTAGTVAAYATARRIPFVALSPAARPSRWVLRALPSGSSRARRLAHHACLLLSKPRLVVLAPETRFGRRTSASFSRALASCGGRVVRSLGYAPRSRSFVSVAKKLKSGGFDAIFVPDSAARLALIAPALAQAALWARAPRGKAPKGGRAFLLLATADGLSTRLVESAGRYVQGAILAPGYYADESATASGPLVRHYRQVTGHLPGLVEAYAHDAVSALRAALETGARGAAALRRALEHGTSGLTGSPRYNARGERSDPPLLYQVDGSALKLVVPKPVVQNKTPS